MMRSAPLKRTTGLKQGGELKRKTPLARTCGLKQGSEIARTPMKKSRPKRRPQAERRYADACRGEPCYLLIPGAPAHPVESVVPCHSNQQKDGKGMGLKASDEKTVPGCAWCHHQLDQGTLLAKGERREYFDDAYRRWVPVRAVKLGLSEGIESTTTAVSCAV